MIVPEVRCKCGTELGVIRTEETEDGLVGLVVEPCIACTAEANEDD